MDGLREGAQCTDLSRARVRSMGDRTLASITFPKGKAESLLAEVVNRS